VQEFFDVPFMDKLWQSFWFSTLFHCGYIIVLLFFATRLFNKKEF
jgi:hypothetical protein